VKVGDSVADLHSDNNKLGKENSLTEKGATVNGRGDTPNTHDMLTGSNADGTLATGTGDVTCGNWTSTATDGHARLGHFDKQGGGEAPNSWNSVHLSSGCTQPNLVATGGETLKPADRVRIPIRTDRDVVGAVAHVDPAAWGCITVRPGSSTLNCRASSLRCFRFSCDGRALTMSVLLV
jgi:hypothetical protein